MKDEWTSLEPPSVLEWPDRAGCDFIGPYLSKLSVWSLLCPPGPVWSSLVGCEGDTKKMTTFATVAQPMIVGASMRTKISIMQWPWISRE